MPVHVEEISEHFSLDLKKYFPVVELKQTSPQLQLQIQRSIQESYYTVVLPFAYSVFLFFYPLKINVFPQNSSGHLTQMQLLRLKEKE